MLLFQTSREIIFYFQHFIQVCFYFLGKKLGGAQAPPAPPLATALFCRGGKGKISWKDQDFYRTPLADHVNSK